MDIQLRGDMDGVQTASAITAQQDVPIVYLTANSDEATLQRAKKTDPFGFLIKPFEERSIQAGIEMALYKHQSEKRNREREQWLSTTLTSIADAVITTDADGKITFLNAAAEKLSGWPQADALGCRYEDVFRILDETSQSAPLDSIARALARRHKRKPGQSHAAGSAGRDEASHRTQRGAHPAGDRGEDRGLRDRVQRCFRAKTSRGSVAPCSKDGCHWQTRGRHRA